MIPVYAPVHVGYVTPVYNSLYVRTSPLRDAIIAEDLRRERVQNELLKLEVSRSIDRFERESEEAMRRKRLDDAERERKDRLDSEIHLRSRLLND